MAGIRAGAQVLEQASDGTGKAIGLGGRGWLGPDAARTTPSKDGAPEKFEFSARANLSKENCVVFTGDPNAQPGGRADPVTNPNGLTSRWCGLSFVAKLWFALN